MNLLFVWYSKKTVWFSKWAHCISVMILKLSNSRHLIIVGFIRQSCCSGRGPHSECEGKGGDRCLQTDQPQHDGVGSRTKTDNISAWSSRQTQHSSSHPRSQQVYIFTRRLRYYLFFVYAKNYLVSDYLIELFPSKFEVRMIAYWKHTNCHSW